MFSMLLYFILVFTLVAEIFMPQIVRMTASGFFANTEKYRLTVTLSRITFPYLVFISLGSLMSGVLQTHGKFLAVAINPLLLNLVFIVSSLLSPLFTLNIAHLLSYAVIIGGALQFICVFLSVVCQKIILYPTRIKMDRSTRKFVKNFFPALLSSGIDQLNSMVVSTMLSGMAGAISQVYYADRLVQLPTALIGTAIGVSILPLLSKRIKQNDDNKFRLQEDAILTALFLGLPSTIYLYRLSYIFVPILFERGEFTGVSSMAVVRCTKIYATALPAFILSKILQSIFFSSGDTKTPMISALISMSSNILLALILRRYLGQEGILLSSVLSAYLDFASLLAILLSKRLLILSDRFLLIFAKMFYALVFLLLTFAACDKFIPFGSAIAPGFVKFIVTALLSGLVYLAISYLLGVINPKKYAPPHS
jgi:putative peptidoglycan lipid II flippase